VRDLGQIGCAGAVFAALADALQNAGDVSTMGAATPMTAYVGVAAMSNDRNT
jgi:hypothetical protein